METISLSTVNRLGISPDLFLVNITDLNLSELKIGVIAAAKFQFIHFP